MPIDTPTSSKQAAHSEEDWRNAAKGMIKAELKRQNLTYEDLATKLAGLGIEETEASIRNKISRGTFSFVFALQAFSAIDVRLVPFKPQIAAELTLPPELMQTAAVVRGRLP